MCCTDKMDTKVFKHLWNSMFTTVKTADIESKNILFVCCVPQFENLKVYVYKQKKVGMCNLRF